MSSYYRANGCDAGKNIERQGYAAYLSLPFGILAVGDLPFAGSRFRMAVSYTHLDVYKRQNPHCPQGIDIPAKLQEIDRFVEALKQETL